MKLISASQPARRKAGGFALMEVLVAMFVLAIGILGAGALQPMGLQANRGAYLRSQAIYMASDMVDRIRENRVARASYLGADTDSSATQALRKPTCTADFAGCSAADIATADLVAWVDKVKTQNILPNGRGQITDLATGDNIRITISWNETDWSEGSTRADNQQQSYTLVAAIKKEIL